MPQASKKTRQIRKLKRERTLAYRLLDLTLKQRDEARAIANLFGNQLEQISQKTEENKKQSDLTITRVPEEPSVEDNQTDRQD